MALGLYFSQPLAIHGTAITRIILPQRLTPRRLQSTPSMRVRVTGQTPYHGVRRGSAAEQGCHHHPREAFVTSVTRL